VGTGLTVSEAGTISGTPTAVGTISFTAQASDQGGDVKTQAYDININDVVAITTTSLPEAYDTKDYSLQIENTGGTAPLSWVDVNDDLDGTGLTLSEGGLLSGAPSIGVTTINFTAEVVDMAGSSDNELFDLIINEAYTCGDTNDDGNIDILDIILLVNYVYKNGDPPVFIQSGDVNSDTIPNGEIDILDIVLLVNLVYKDGREPVCP
ncbi:MAG: hypothetical protein GY865_14430, partial [candidate division Zixibacteria bacterium]|nr:hypothetical protein [candidate division Zixibacteria bacterium]